MTDKLFAGIKLLFNKGYCWLHRKDELHVDNQIVIVCIKNGKICLIIYFC